MIFFIIYTGDFKNGKNHGEGIENRFNENGDVVIRYSGSFKDGFFHGQGELSSYTPDGNSVFTGTFNLNKIVNGVYTTPGGVLEGIFDASR